MSETNITSGVTEGVHWLAGDHRDNTPLLLVTGMSTGGSPDRTADPEHDLDLEAITQLEAKVGCVISKAEFDCFVESGKSCTSLKRAKFEFDEVERECHTKLKKTSFHRFFHGLNALFEPLGLIANALDTLSQVHSTFCLIWGSLKVLISVCIQSSIYLSLLFSYVYRSIGTFIRFN